MGDLSYNDIVEVNKRLGEKGTVINAGNLHFVIDKEKMAKTVVSKAAILLHGIITSHSFLEGNKRTGFNSMVLLLEINGKTVKQTVVDEDIVRFLYEIAQNRVSERETEKWISELIE